MSERLVNDGAVRRLNILLALAYPVIAHVAVARESVDLTVVALGVLAAVMLLPSLFRGRIAAWIAVPVVVACCWWVAHTALPVLPLYAAPVLVPAFLAWAFGHTLLSGRTPLIAQLVRALHAPGEEPPSGVWAYARKLTLAWTILFIVLASSNFVLALLAEPDGLLLASGIQPPLTVPQEWWSLFANLIGYLVVAAFFTIEYAYRRYRFPQQPYRNMFDFIRRTFAALPRLLDQ